MSRRFLFCAVAAVVLTATLLAGCGGGGGDATYTQGTTWHCLGGLGWDVNTNVSDLDYIAQDAQNALEASTARVAVTITFDRTSSDAERTEAAYKAASLGTPTGDVLIRKGNAVVSWDRAPTGEERDEVDGCLY